MAHLMVARIFGYPAICWGISHRFFAIVFLDQPSKSYWALQIALPLLATASVLHQGFFILPPASYLSTQLLSGFQPFQLIVSTALAFATSSADISSMFEDLRHPRNGLARIAQNIWLLRKESLWVQFTAYGQHFVRSEFGLSPEECLRSTFVDLGKYQEAFSRSEVNPDLTKASC